MKRVAIVSIAAAAVISLPSRGAAQQTRTDAVQARAHWSASTAYLGLRVGGVPRPAQDGAARWADYPVVRSVDAGSPAARVGIEAGDVLLQVNGVDARDPRTLFGRPGKVFTIRVRRDGQVHEFVIASEPPPVAT
jgi:C-terminal processing protease CtpA/Prc